MKAPKPSLLKLLDQIALHQKEISTCHDYYAQLEKELEAKRNHLANQEDFSDFSRQIETLNREYEARMGVMYETLNEDLIKGFDLAKEIGHEIAHDYKKLWDYMTDSMHQEVKLERVLKEIERVKRDFLA